MELTEEPFPSFMNKFVKAILHPKRLVDHVRRHLRNAAIPKSDHYDFYRKVVDDNASRDPDAAIGSNSRQQWLEVGDLQFCYLQEHGLKPDQRFLDLGCGNLRLGWRAIQFLNPGMYSGIDISPVILDAARKTISEFNLEAKQPALHLVESADYSFLPDDHFDIVYAHGVFTQTPIGVVEAVLKSVHRVLKPGCFFEFTYNCTTGEEHNYMNEDFFFKRDTMINAVRSAGFEPEEMKDWKYTQEKIRAHKPKL